MTLSKSPLSFASSKAVSKIWINSSLISGNAIDTFKNDDDDDAFCYSFITGKLFLVYESNINLVGRI